MMRSEMDLVKYKQEEYRRTHPETPLAPRIAGLDPGRQKDSFGMVGIEIRDRKDIHIIGAQEWKYKDYSDTEEQVEVIQRTIVRRPFKYIVVETNNAGWHVVENLRKLGLPILAANTTGKITDPKKLLSGKSMPKNNTVEWVQRVIQDTRKGRTDRTNLFFPAKHSDGTLRLWNQLPKFTRKITPSGSLSYGAQGQEHDDLVMALVLACHIARLRFIKKGLGKMPIVTKNLTKKLRPKRAEDYFPEIAANPYNRITDHSVSG